MDLGESDLLRMHDSYYEQCFKTDINNNYISSEFQLFFNATLLQFVQVGVEINCELIN